MDFSVTVTSTFWLVLNTVDLKKETSSLAKTMQVISFWTIKPFKIKGSKVVYKEINTLLTMKSTASTFLFPEVDRLNVISPKS